MKHPFSRFFSFGEKEQEETMEKQEKEEVRKIPVSKIVPNRFQPRTIFDEEKIEELALT
ncbi:nucleoid occlusion protein, partial [Parageobacillus sp. SY1]